MFTREYPNQAGWYWVKTQADDNFPEIMHCQYFEDGFSHYPPGYYFIKDDFPVKLKTGNGWDWHFAGPLQPPE